MTATSNSGINSGVSTSDTIDDAKEELSSVTQASADTAREVAESRFEQGREATTEQLDSASEAIGDVAQKLEENDSPFASYAAELSDQLSSFSGKLSTSSIDDLVGGARSLARENPAAFMLGSMAIGLAASRFFKASGEQVQRQSTDTAARSDHDRSGTRLNSGYSGTYGAQSATGMPRSNTTTATAGVRPDVSKPVVDRGNASTADDLNEHDALTRQSRRTDTEGV